jgi:HEPN superfamily RiboL-PSP-like protein
MAKIRTLTQLQEALDAEMSWRIKEISDFKLATKTQPATSRTFIRAGVALVYAHWEGFIKAASERYLDYVDNKGHIYLELKTCFAVFGLKGKLTLLSGSRKAKRNIEALDFIFNEMKKPARMSMRSAIDTESNLTSKVFANIAESIDISLSRYETKFNLIDESLVRRRNRVAHGEYLDLSAADFLVLADEILQMMRSYKTDIENAASLESYKRPTPPTEAVAQALA